MMNFDVSDGGSSSHIDTWSNFKSCEISCITLGDIKQCLLSSANPVQAMSQTQSIHG